MFVPFFPLSRIVGTWSEWSSCVVAQKCSNGTQSRTCIGPGDCPSDEETVQVCTTQNDEECSSVTLVQEGLNCEQHCNKTGINNDNRLDYPSSQISLNF